MKNIYLAAVLLQCISFLSVSHAFGDCVSDIEGGGVMFFPWEHFSYPPGYPMGCVSGYYDGLVGSAQHSPGSYNVMTYSIAPEGGGCEWGRYCLIPTVAQTDPGASSPPQITPPTCGSGSIIHTDNQSVGERVPVVGAPFDLVYFTDKVLGRAANYTVSSPVFASTVPSGVTGATITITYAGTRTYTHTYSATANTTDTFVWDGLDSSGHPVLGSTTAQVTLDYPGFFLTGLVPDLVYPIQVGSEQATVFGLGAWIPSILHFYDTTAQILYLGTGSARPVVASPYASGTQWIAASEDGSELYIFNSSGKHLQTLNGLTGATLYTFAYDSNGFISTVTDAYSHVTTIERNMSGVLTGILAPNGQTTTLTLDTNGYLASIVNPNSETYTMTYYTGGLIHTFQKPVGQTSTFTYDTNGLLTLDSSSAGNSTSLASTGALLSGLTLQSTSAVGRQTTFSITDYLPATVVKNTTYPDSSSGTFQTDSASYLQTSAPGVFQNIAFQPDARLAALSNFNIQNDVNSAGVASTITSTQSLPSWTQSLDLTNPTYFNYTTIDTQDTVNGYVWDKNFTLSTGTTVITSPVGRTQTLVQDTYGKLTSAKIASYTPNAYTYNSDGRLSQIAQSTRTTTLAYNTHGLVSSVTSPLSEVNAFTYDNAGRVLTQTLPDSRVIDYAYDTNGNLTSVTPPSANVHSFVINLFDLISEYDPPALGSSTVHTQYAYNNDKQLTLVTRPDASTVAYGYDATTGQLTGVTIAAGSYTYSYDLNGYTNYAISPDNVTLWPTYTGPYLTSEELDNQGTVKGTLTQTFTNDFNLSNATVSPASGSASSIAYLYDHDAAMSKAGTQTISRSSTSGFVTGTVENKISEAYTYDSTYGEMSAYSASFTGTPAATIFSESFTRDADGRISAKSETIGSTTNAYGYTYDTAGRLSAVTLNTAAYSSYTYDTNSNRTSGNVGGTSFTGTYDAQDRLSTYNTKTFTYHLNGDLYTMVDSSLPSGHQTSTYTYDELGNLKTAVLPSKTVTYLVDAQNRRAVKKTGTTVNAIYLYRDQTRLEAILNSAGTLNTRFVWGVRPNIPDYMVKSGTTYKIIADERGSVRFVVNASTGVVSEQITYDEFGNILTDTSPGFQPFGFAGCLYDTDTKLCHFGARDYDASIGRWLNKDPVLFGGGDTNLYGYVLQDPVNLTDPRGLSAAGGYAKCAVGSILVVGGLLGAGELGFLTVPTVSLGAYEYKQGLNDIHNAAVCVPLDSSKPQKNNSSGNSPNTAADPLDQPNSNSCPKDGE
jgi:RHS repeat-associated protein